MNIERRYIVDEKNQKIAVQLDIKTFEKIEVILENHGLTRLMSADEDGEVLDLAEAKIYYQGLDKTK